MPIRRCLVMHFTSGATAMSSIRFWRSSAAKGACAHVIIDRDGTIYQCRPFNRTCGHAGKPGDARWVDPNTGIKYGTPNAYGIGIELANAGDDVALANKWGVMEPKTIRLKHRNDGIAEWERFPDAQIAACGFVSLALVHRYNLDDVTSHDAIAPERKNDVGPAFPLKGLRATCGFAGLPVVHWP